MTRISITSRKVAGISFFILIMACGLIFAAPKLVIKLAETSWDTNRISNATASFIFQNGYGYAVERVPAESIMLWAALRRGDVNALLEAWPRAYPEAYKEGIDSGDVTKLGDNYGTVEGWLVPRYVVEGDTARGIKAVAPSLQYVDDLPKYWKVFQDPEDPTKGRLYGGVPGWGAEKTGTMKFETYGLDKYYIFFRTGSDAAQVASMVSAYERGKPWLGYYWAPSWVLGKLDMVFIKEKVPFDEAVWNKNRACDWPKASSEIVANTKWIKTQAPKEVVDFLQNFTTTSEEINTYLLYMENHKGVTDDDVAAFFLKKYQSTWVNWITADAAKKVSAALAQVKIPE